jgi:putative copper resistance protein D
LVFVIMLAIASINRMRLTPLLSTVDESGNGLNASLRLRRNVWTERALGAGLVAIVAALGVTPPPMAISM